MRTGARRRRDADEALARLRVAETVGERRSARGKVRHLLETAPERDDLRLALAESFRRTGDLSQAGRWGVSSPGWSTPAEIRDLRRWLAGRAASFVSTRQLLLLDADEPVPEDVADLASGDAVFPPSPPRTMTDRVGEVSAITLVLAVVALIPASVVVVVFFLVQRNADIPLLVCGALVAVAAAGAGGISLAERRSVDPVPVEWPSMDDQLALTRRLRAAGREDEAAIRLRRLVETGADDRARRDLVDMHRVHRRHDEAGRWGAPVPGLTTVRERAAFAAAVRSAARQVGDDTPDGRQQALRRATLVYRDVLLGDLADVARRADASTALRPDPVPAPTALSEKAYAGFVGLGAAGGVAGFTVAGVASAVDSGVADEIARAVTVSVLAVLSVESSVGAFRARSVPARGWLTGLSVAVLALTLMAGVSWFG